MIALLIAASSAMFVSLIGTRYLVPWLQARGVGQPIRLDGPQGHITKAGTPTMGGAAVVAAAVVGYVVSHLRAETVMTRSGIVLLATVSAAGLVGLADDWIKVSRERNLGLNKRAKLIGLIAVGIGFAAASVWWVNLDTAVGFTRLSGNALRVPAAVWILWAVLIILGTSNAVNLTDGLDGLAAGAASVAFAAFVVVGYWAFRHPISYDVKHPLDLAIVAAAMAGACAGFLWWNAPPARIFMGDTGSLAIGTAMGGLAMLLHVDLLLPVIGGLYVIETGVGHHPGRLVPAFRSTPIPDGPHAPSPRAGGMARDHGAHPPLGREQPARGTRARPLLRRLLESRPRRTAGRLAMNAGHLSDARRTVPDVLRPDDGPVLVVGMGVTGCAVATALGARGHEIIVADDRPDAAAAKAASAGLASVEIHDSTDHGLLSALMSNAAAVVPSPGVPPRHPSYTLADSAGVPVVSELDLGGTVGQPPPCRNHWHQWQDDGHGAHRTNAEPERDQCSRRREHRCCLGGRRSTGRSPPLLWRPRRSGFTGPAALPLLWPRG